jgi:hypothetical protein
MKSIASRKQSQFRATFERLGTAGFVAIGDHWGALGSQT